VVALTADLDKVSEAMFALRTNGGDDYGGQVISVATQQLAWSGSNKDVKCIFIAGNEPFSQGTVDFRDACKASQLYRNTGWDLVDAVQEGKVKIEDLKEDQLPESLKKMSLEERKAQVSKLSDQRKAIQAKIGKLGQLRRVCLAEQERKVQATASAPAASFERAVTESVKAQVNRK